MALSWHCSVIHSIANKSPLREAVTFIEQPSFRSLDKCEDKWHNKLGAKINIQGILIFARFCVAALTCFELFDCPVN